MKEGFNHETKSTLYIDLDSLYDTRLAILEAVDPAYASYMMTHGYFNRVVDKFEFIDDATYSLIWRTRSMNILKNAITTPMVKFIGRFLLDSIERRESSPFDADIKIYLNIWPYKMTKQQAEQLAQPVLNIIKDQEVELNIINMKPSDITVKWCREHLAVMVMYDWGIWIDANFENGNKGFLENTIPDICVIVPELYNYRWTQKQEDTYKRKYGNLFRVAEEAARFMMDLTMFPISDFCADIPNDMLLKIKERYPAIELVDDTGSKEVNHSVVDSSIIITKV